MYYIASLDTGDPERVARAIRSHWEVENKVHWVLDVTFREDDCRIRRDDGAQNIGLVRRMCLNLTRVHPKKDSMAGKLKAAGWNDKFRAELIFGNAA
jgi:predicted transposase YbfD/YdcC